MHISHTGEAALCGFVAQEGMGLGSAVWESAYLLSEHIQGFTRVLDVKMKTVVEVRYLC